MSQQEKHFYEFGEFHLDLAKRRLLRNGEIVPLTPKAFDLLLTLVEQSGRTLEKDELMQRIWPDTAVEENNLTQNIYTLRKVFGESRNESRYIATVPGVGYRFVAEVRRAPFADEEITIREKTEVRVAVTETIEEDETPPLVAAAPPLLTAPASHRHKKLIGALLALVVVLAAGLAYVTVQYWRARRSAAAFREVKVNQLTFNGTTLRATISPDGEHIIHSIKEGDRQSLWLRQVATGSAQQIAPSEAADYRSLHYSHDGAWLYFVKRKPGEAENKLYKMAALGGVPTQLITGLEPCIALSPDDRRLAFIRNSANASLLLIANSDGSAERQLAARPLTDYFKVPAWSPDGQTIACTTGSGENVNQQNSVVGVSLADGQQKPLTTRKWPWTRWVEWLSDGSGLLLTATADDLIAAPIWHISYPQGEVRQITKDARQYFSLSLTADAGALAATQTRLLSEIWLTSLNERGAAKKLTLGTGVYSQVSLAAEGRILYSSLENGNEDIWRMNAEGQERQRLTADPGADSQPTVSPDGRYIVFTSNRAGVFNLWRMESDGGNPVRLTTGSGEKFPCVSPDGAWVVYNSVAAAEQLYSLWKVPLAGGQPVWLAAQTHKAAISPDGRRLAYFARHSRELHRPRIVVMSFAGGPPEQVFDLPPDSLPMPEVLHWTADGRALLYAAEQQGFSDIWRQPLEGGPVSRVTELKMEGRLFFAPSADGKRLVLTRRLWTYDLLLLTSFR